MSQYRKETTPSDSGYGFPEFDRVVLGVVDAGEAADAFHFAFVADLDAR